MTISAILDHNSRNDAPLATKRGKNAPTRRGKGLNELQTRRIRECATKYRSGLEKAYLGKASPRAAIKAMCLHCMCEDRAEITKCTSTGCPLHQYRPFQGGEE
jgi:hypothetical protein